MQAKRKRVKRRRYVSTIRSDAAQRTRQRILDAAVGRKPELVRLLIETAISNTQQAVPAEQRGYVQRIQAAATAREKLALYAAAVVDIQGRLAPLVRALEVAAAAEPAH